MDGFSALWEISSDKERLVTHISYSNPNHSLSTLHTSHMPTAQGDLQWINHVQSERFVLSIRKVPYIHIYIIYIIYILICTYTNLDMLLIDGLRDSKLPACFPQTFLQQGGIILRNHDPGVKFTQHLAVGTCYVDSDASSCVDMLRIKLPQI